jgi:hypothetical protein
MLEIKDNPDRSLTVTSDDADGENARLMECFEGSRLRALVRKAHSEGGLMTVQIGADDRKDFLAGIAGDFPDVVDEVMTALRTEPEYGGLKPPL